MGQVESIGPCWRPERGHASGKRTTSSTLYTPPFTTCLSARPRGSASTHDYSKGERQRQTRERRLYSPQRKSSPPITRSSKPGPSVAHGKRRRPAFLKILHGNRMPSRPQRDQARSLDGGVQPVAVNHEFRPDKNPAAVIRQDVERNRAHLSARSRYPSKRSPKFSSRSVTSRLNDSATPSSAGSSAAKSGSASHFPS